MSDVKRCSRCGRVLPVSSFSRSSKNKDGLQCWCKDCQRACHCSSSRRACGSRSTPSVSKLSGDALGLLSMADMRAQNIKLCTRCQTVKPLSAFSPNRHNADGHQSWCKSCCTSYASSRRASRAEEFHKKVIKDGLSLHVPSRRVVARNGVPVSGEPVPKNLKPLLSVGDFRVRLFQLRLSLRSFPQMALLLWILRMQLILFSLGLVPGSFSRSFRLVVLTCAARVMLRYV